MKRKLIEQIKHIPALSPAAISSATNGTVIDRKGYLSANVLLSLGAATGSPTAISVETKLQHGNAADGSDMADVSGAVLTVLTAENSNTSKDFDLVGLKRYIRIVVTPTLTGGSSPTISTSACIVLGDSNIEPTV